MVKLENSCWFSNARLASFAHLSVISQIQMRRLLTAAAASSLLMAQMPVLAEGKADDPGVMNVSLKETVKPRFGFQGQTQGAGTPNGVGIGGFLPFAIGENSVWFGSSIVRSTPTLKTSTTTAALSAPVLLGPPSRPHPVLVIAG